MERPRLAATADPPVDGPRSASAKLGGDAVGSTAAPEAGRLSSGMERPRLAATADPPVDGPRSASAKLGGDAVGSTAAPEAGRYCKRLYLTMYQRAATPSRQPIFLPSSKRRAS